MRTVRRSKNRQQPLTQIQTHQVVHRPVRAALLQLLAVVQLVNLLAAVRLKRQTLQKQKLPQIILVAIGRGQRALTKLLIP